MHEAILTCYCFNYFQRWKECSGPLVSAAIQQCVDAPLQVSTVVSLKVLRVPKVKYSFCRKMFPVTDIISDIIRLILMHQCKRNILLL